VSLETDRQGIPVCCLAPNLGVGAAGEAAVTRGVWPGFGGGVSLDGAATVTSGITGLGTGLVIGGEATISSG
jgi:hypothetical protein